MRLATYTRLLAPLGLLAVTTSASAECAWVLWGQWGQGSMTPQDAATSAAACKQVLAIHRDRTSKNIQLILSSVPADQQNRPMRDVLSADQMTDLTNLTNLMESYRCLPDTVDPRGPKGK